MKKSLILLLLSLGCTKGFISAEGPGENNILSSAKKSLLGVRDATAEECPNGGKVYSVYVDTNENNTQDTTENPLSNQIVCNGINGSDGQNGNDGYSTVFLLERVSTTSAACESESGLQLQSGLDLNRNTTLEGSEITQTQIVCDGKNGEVGAAGPPGSNGHNVVFQISPAPPEVCSAGGSVIVMALDVFDLGVYSPLDPGQQSMTVCNGQNGSDGQDAPPSAYTPLDIILPCGNTVAFKEVLLRMYNGEVLASFSENANGRNTRLSFLPDGTYENTDSSNCVFSLSRSGSTRSISWFNQVQLSWTMPN